MYLSKFDVTALWHYDGVIIITYSFAFTVGNIDTINCSYCYKVHCNSVVPS